MKKAKHLNIKNDEAHKLATELADLTGESLTAAVTLALRERLARERRRRRPDRIAARLMMIGSQYAALADTGRNPNEILGYDEHRLLPT
jgi:antitoxin VapB